MSTLVKDLVIDKHKEGLIERLEEAPTAAPQRHWRGDFRITRGEPMGLTISIAADIAFHGPLIEGRGRITSMREGAPDIADSLSLTGTQEADGRVSLQVWFDTAQLKAVPIDASGTLSTDQCRIDGDWHYACFCERRHADPCDGRSGSFHLEQVTE